MTNKPLTRTALVLIILSGLAACGGGGGSSAPATQNTSKGAITAFGSIYVNGVEYETSGATVTMEGQPASESDLRVGMVVCVVKDSQGTAAAVYYDDDLEGPVTAVDAAAGTFVVNGQTVTTDATTVFDDGITSLADIVVDTTVVEVSGYDNGNGITATRVEAGSNDGSGDNSDPCDSSGHDGDEYELKGTVTAIDATSITVNGQTFLINDSTEVEHDSMNTINVGDLVEVEGHYNSAGVLVAHEIEMEDDHPDLAPSFYGTVASVTVDANSPNVGTITLMDGSVINVDANTIMHDSKGNTPETHFNLTDVVAGDYLEIHAYSTGTNAYTAVKIEREDAPAPPPAPAV